MTEAQRHCRENYMDLATIRDLEDLETLKTLKTPIQSRAWAGLYDDVDSWRWSLSNASFYKPGETEFRRWQLGEPHNRLKEYCTLLTPDGEWRDIMCDEILPPICYDVTGPDTYVFINTLMTWPEAQSYCREHHTDLASVRNMEDNARLSTVINGEFVWIGLSRDGWKWSDGSDSSFRNWNPNELVGLYTKSCLSVDFSADGQWESLDCNVKSAFICYSDIVVSKRVVKVRLEKSSSSLDLKDPVVMEDLLKKLKQRLEDQGLNGDIKLSWRKQSDGEVFHKEEKTQKRRDEL
ncbi:C-type mannose receptor 2-like [Pseudoliparis swirei]|uniref:C-type mannose receptor 2-like n=1 Tax=Pseudoliparis swirei TaxID=2059687 RepID=UPI0024BE5B3E|nr:C-type mannose receptor 2-like [Pseudoliparis swirei]